MSSKKLKKKIQGKFPPYFKTNLLRLNVCYLESVVGVPQLQSSDSASTGKFTLQENVFAGLTHVSAVTRPIKAGGFLAQEVLDNLKRFPHCLLLTRVGQFYEVSSLNISKLCTLKPHL